MLHEAILSGIVTLQGFVQRLRLVDPILKADNRGINILSDSYEHFISSSLSNIPPIQDQTSYKGPKATLGDGLAIDWQDVGRQKREREAECSVVMIQRH